MKRAGGPPNILPPSLVRMQNPSWGRVTKAVGPHLHPQRCLEVSSVAPSGVCRLSGTWGPAISSLKQARPCPGIPALRTDGLCVLAAEGAEIGLNVLKGVGDSRKE